MNMSMSNQAYLSFQTIEKFAKHFNAMEPDAIRVIFKEYLDDSADELTWKKLYKILHTLSLDRDNPGRVKDIILSSLNLSLYTQVDISVVELLEKYNDWLKSERKEILIVGNGYLIHEKLPNESEIRKIGYEEAQQEEAILASVLKPYIKDIAEIRYSYRLLMQIVNAFFQKSFPVDQPLNDYYIKLFEIVESKIDSIHSTLAIEYEKYINLGGFEGYYDGLPKDYINPYIYRNYDYENALFRPFKNFYTAATEMAEEKRDWSAIKKRMQACYGILEDNFHRFCKDEIIAIPNQKFIDEVSESIQLTTEEKHFAEVPQSNKTKSPDTTNNDLQHEKELWSDDLHWKNDDKFEFLYKNKEVVSFERKNSQIVNLFRRLVIGKGYWVSVKDLTKWASISSDNKTRIRLRELAKRCKETGIITIVAKGGTSGANRIKYFTQP